MSASRGIKARQTVVARARAGVAITTARLLAEYCLSTLDAAEILLTVVDATKIPDAKVAIPTMATAFTEARAAVRKAMERL